MSADRTRPPEAAGWRPRLRAVTTSLALAVGGLFAAALVSAVGFQLLLEAGVPVRGNMTLQYPVGTILMGLAFGGVVAGYLLATDRTDLLAARLPTPRDLGWTVLGVVALLATLVVVGTILDQFGIRAAEHRLAAIAREDPTVLLYMLPLAFLVIGPSEELLFRGAIQGLLRRVYRPLPAILIASVVFAIGHVFALSGSRASRLSTVVAILLLGSILGALYEFTDNLVVPSLVHGAYDAVVFVQLYVTVTGAG